MRKLSIAGWALVAIAVGSCSITPVTFVLGGDAPDAADAPGDAPDGGPDAASNLDAAVAPPSCKAIHAADPSLPSGTYEIDPDGAGGDLPATVTCDMTMDGGGWTIVFLAPAADLSMVPISYTGGTPRLMADAESVLLVYRNAAEAALPGHARFDLPVAWRTTPPFNVDHTDLTVPVSINGGAPEDKTLRYGKYTFSTRCDHAWLTSAMWGRICIVGTQAPFYAGFANVADDTCTDSLSEYTVTACTNDRRFSIAVR